MIRCWLFGHKELKLAVLKDKPFIAVADISGPLFSVHMCERCNLIYWECA